MSETTGPIATPEEFELERAEKREAAILRDIGTNLAKVRDDRKLLRITRRDINYLRERLGRPTLAENPEDDNGTE